MKKGLSVLIALLYLVSPLHAWGGGASSPQKVRNGHDLKMQISVMVNGVPGPMAVAVAEACLDRGFHVVPMAFTGPQIRENEVIIKGEKRTQWVELVTGPGHNDEAGAKLAKLKADYPDLVVVDYTHPSAVTNNIKCYVENDADFVMGTTGGDPSEIDPLLEKAKNIAVLAPNMAKQIVALQATLKEMAARYPRSFEGYTLTVTESHQSKKADTSGTAKAVVAHLVDLNGGNFDEAFNSIVKLRTKESSMNFGVPEQYVDAGHAFHTYHLTSADGSVHFELQHNVCGRRVYAEGTADAVGFVVDQQKALKNASRKRYLLKRLWGKLTGGGIKRVFDMIDILEAEKMK